MYIYKIRNLKNNKEYVGQTSYKIEKRLSNHIKSAKRKINRRLYDAMNHHGYDNFVVELIEIVDKFNANNREIYWINNLKTLVPNGYNMTRGGGGGYTLSSWSETKRKAFYKAQGNKRRGPRSEKWKEAIRQASLLREANKTDIQRENVSKKISKTLIKKKIKPPLHVMYGKENPNYTFVDTQKCVELIKNGWKLIDLAEKFKTTTVTIGSKLVAETGKTFTAWRRIHGITGPFGKVQRINTSP